MRYCHSCRHITTGQPLFCNFCGHSYDVRLCPSRHINPRAATVCSQCGSHELSSPQPPVPFPISMSLRLLRILPGVLLFLITVSFFLTLVKTVLENAALQAEALWVGLFLAFVWWVYLQLPGFVRRGFRGITKRKGGGHERH